MRYTENEVITTLEFLIDLSTCSIYKTLPITCIDILGLYFCANHAK